jgi:hypothetical protein
VHLGVAGDCGGDDERQRPMDVAVALDLRPPEQIACGRPGQPEERRVERGGRRWAEIDRLRPRGAGVMDEGVTDAAEAGIPRLDRRQGEGGGNGRIDRVAAGIEHGKARGACAAHLRRYDPAPPGCGGLGQVPVLRDVGGGCEGHRARQAGPAHGKGPKPRERYCARQARAAVGGRIISSARVARQDQRARIAPSDSVPLMRTVRPLISVATVSLQAAPMFVSIAPRPASSAPSSCASRPLTTPSLLWVSQPSGASAPTCGPSGFARNFAAAPAAGGGWWANGSVPPRSVGAVWLVELTALRARLQAACRGAGIR